MLNENNLCNIIDFILEKYHNPLRINLEKISFLLNKIVDVHSEHHPEFIEIRSVFNNFKKDILEHIDKEEKILFPIMREIEKSYTENRIIWKFHCWNVINPIKQMEIEHDKFDKYLTDIRILSSNYFIPDDACQAFSTTYKMLELLDKETLEHASLENNILHKLAIEKENICKK